MVVFFALVLLFVPFLPTQAYLDPGSGSFIIQLIIGAFLGSLIALKIYFKKIKGFVLSPFSKKPVPQEKQDGKSDEKQ